MKCILFPGFFGVVVQVFLAVLCFGSLLLKWHREEPQRPPLVFARDSSKQLVGSGWLHFLNIVCAVIFTEDSGLADQCDWYWINIVVDTTFGVLIVYRLLRLSESAFEYKSGEYGECQKSSTTTPNGTVTRATFLEMLSPEYRKQIGIWILVVTGMKLCTVGAFLLFNRPLQELSIAILHLLFGERHNSVKLLFVMLLTPLMMNTFQLWVTDTFIKAKASLKDGEMTSSEAGASNGSLDLMRNRVGTTNLLEHLVADAVE